MSAITAIIPTANRPGALRSTLLSLAMQGIQPAEIIIVDASENDATTKICCQEIPGLVSRIIYQKAIEKGAASQRNEGLRHITNPLVFFCDDDIRLEEGCVERLLHCLQSDDRIGGVNAMITNQRYHSPGKLTRFMYLLMSGQLLETYAGKCIGPAWNLLPEDGDNLPMCNKTEWLNTTCTLYRREALPSPLFSKIFKGYSLMEDVYLSLNVAKKWDLYNARTARIFHDSQTGTHKNNVMKISKMEMVNRHYIMTCVLERRTSRDYFKLFLFEIFGLITSLSGITGIKKLIPNIAGKFSGTFAILFTKRNYGQ